jgi:hypothetical protein
MFTYPDGNILSISLNLGIHIDHVVDPPIMVGRGRAFRGNELLLTLFSSRRWCRIGDSP